MNPSPWRVTFDVYDQYNAEWCNNEARDHGCKRQAVTTYLYHLSYNPLYLRNLKIWKWSERRGIYVDVTANLNRWLGSEVI